LEAERGATPPPALSGAVVRPEVVWPVLIVLACGDLVLWLYVRHLTRVRDEEPPDVRKPEFTDPLSRKRRGED
jgi:hypothetical protein